MPYFGLTSPFLVSPLLKKCATSPGFLCALLRSGCAAYSGFTVRLAPVFAGISKRLRTRGKKWRGRTYVEGEDSREDGGFGAVMLHYAINRPVGAVRGESDLAPLLRWLSRYAAWLEDRARLNRYRNSVYVCGEGRWQAKRSGGAAGSARAARPRRGHPGNG
jgi:hypothetical protein